MSTSQKQDNLKQQIRDTLENNTVVDIDFILLEPLVDQLSALFITALEEAKMEQAPRQSGDSGYWYDVAVEKGNAKLSALQEELKGE